MHPGEAIAQFYRIGLEWAIGNQNHKLFGADVLVEMRSQPPKSSESGKLKFSVSAQTVSVYQLKLQQGKTSLFKYFSGLCGSRSTDNGTFCPLEKRWQQTEYGQFESARDFEFV